jgi:hypothetical protein
MKHHLRLMGTAVASILAGWFVYSLVVSQMMLAHLGIHHAYANTQFIAFAYYATGGTSTRIEPNRWLDHGVNILEFGACPDYTCDSTAPIQAAIDYSINSGGNRAIYCPQGQYKTTYPLFLDAPGGLRGSSSSTWPAGQTWEGTWASGTTYATGAVVQRNGVPFVSLQSSNVGNDPLDDLGNGFNPVFWQTTVTQVSTSVSYQGSYAWDGSPGISGSSTLVAGCVLRPLFNNAEAFWIGPGNYNVVQNLTVTPGNVGTRCQNPATGVGIAVAGGNEGAHFTKIENVNVQSFYASIKFSAGPNGALADSNSIIKSNLVNACIAAYYAHTQAFINEILESDLSANIAVAANLGTGVNVFGGNFTMYEGPTGAAFAVTGLSCSDPSGLATCTATITSPDSYLSNSLCASNTQCLYNAGVIATSNHGLVPFLITGYSAGTLTFKFGANVGNGEVLNISNWYGEYNNTCCLNLVTDVEAQSTIYLAEMATVFWGNRIHATGVHIENAQLPTQLINSQTLFGSTSPSTLEQIYFNYDPSLSPVASPSGGALATYYVTQAFPFVYCDGSGPLKLSGLASGKIHDGLMVDCDNNLKLEEFGFRWPFNYRAGITSNNNTFTQGYTDTVSPGNGSGEGDTPITSNANTFADQFRSVGWGKAPTWGFRPAPWTRPCLTPAQVTTLTGSLPAITSTGSGSSVVFTVSYPLMWGGQQYQVCDWNSPTHNSVVSSHKFYTYGQNLTTSNVPNLSWSLARGANVINMNVETLELMFEGLGFTLTCNSMTKSGIVTEVHLGVNSPIGYVAYVDADQDGSPYLFDFNQDCSGTTIGQPAFNITQF